MMNYLCSDCVNIFKVFAKVKFIPVRTGKYLTTETLSGNDVQTAPKIIKIFEISENSENSAGKIFRYFSTFSTN